MKKRKRNLFLALSTIVILLAWIFWTNTSITVSRYTIDSAKITSDSNGFKIVQVSDLHNHDWRTKLIKKIQKEFPNIIVVTGDLVDSSHPDIEVAMDFIKKALKIAPVFYVTGNHEAWLTDYDKLEQKLKAAGVIILDNTHMLLDFDKYSLNIIGIKDSDFQQGDGVVATIESQMESDHYNIVLSHRPELFKEYVKTDADLVLTGHAHGGQFRIPFVGGVVAPNQGLFPKYTAGLKTERDTTMIVSRGLGNSIIPVRINNIPELVVVTLK